MWEPQVSLHMSSSYIFFSCHDKFLLYFHYNMYCCIFSIICLENHTLKSYSLIITAQLQHIQSSFLYCWQDKSTFRFLESHGQTYLGRALVHRWTTPWAVCHKTTHLILWKTLHEILLQGLSISLETVTLYKHIQEPFIKFHWTDTTQFPLQSYTLSLHSWSKTSKRNFCC